MFLEYVDFGFGCYWFWKQPSFCVKSVTYGHCFGNGLTSPQSYSWSWWLCSRVRVEMVRVEMVWHLLSLSYSWSWWLCSSSHNTILRVFRWLWDPQKLSLAIAVEVMTSFTGNGIIEGWLEVHSSRGTHSNGGLNRIWCFWPRCAPSFANCCQVTALCALCEVLSWLVVGLLFLIEVRSAGWCAWEHHKWSTIPSQKQGTSALWECRWKTHSDSGECSKTWLKSIQCPVQSKFSCFFVVVCYCIILYSSW